MNAPALHPQIHHRIFDLDSLALAEDSPWRSLRHPLTLNLTLTLSHRNRQPEFDPRIDAQKCVLTLTITLITLTLSLMALTLTLILTLTLSLIVLTLIPLEIA